MIVFENKRSYHSELINKENEDYLNTLKSYLETDKTGSGLFNTLLRKIPIPEMHLKLPSGVQSEQVPNGSFNDKQTYSYCGPGTKVRQRLQEGYEGVNSLDKACKQHDIYYSQHTKTKDRNIADDILAKKAADIALDPNELEYVKSHAKLVNAIMTGKSWAGLGIPKNGVRTSKK